MSLGCQVVGAAQPRLRYHRLRICDTSATIDWRCAKPTTSEKTKLTYGHRAKN